MFLINFYEPQFLTFSLPLKIKNEHFLQLCTLSSSIQAKQVLGGTKTNIGGKTLQIAEFSGAMSSVSPIIKKIVSLSSQFLNFMEESDFVVLYHP